MNGGGRFWSLGLILLLKLVVGQQRGKVLHLGLTLHPAWGVSFWKRESLYLPERSWAGWLWGEGGSQPAGKGRWMREGHWRLEEGETLQVWEGAEQGSNRPWPGPRVMWREISQRPTNTVRFAATQNVLAAVGLRKKPERQRTCSAKM